jgi:CHAT domain-containing protein
MIFNLDEFRESAGEYFDENWVALDYYMMNDRVICVLITSQSCKVINVGYPGRARFVVSGLDNTLTMGRWQQNDLDVIGKWLLPEEVLEQLAPDSVLLIAPHRQLNHFPWSALSAAGEPLVGRSIPVIVPSLQSLAALMGRPKRKSSLDKGLLLAVSEFNERYEPLPFTIDETKSLLQLYPESEALLNEAATWPALLGLAEGSGLSSYAFLHIASHAFADGVSGRLSGLAMFDRDVWLDELWNCAPFPALVTLSACSGSKSR